MKELFLDALIDSAKMIPFLLVIYFLVELFERKFGNTIEHRLEKTGKAGPLLGALFGCVPQCGFSVVAASLYSRRIITAGTLMAVFLSTSDEAIPVLLSAPDQTKTVALLLGIKLVIALVAGTVMDLLIRQRKPAAATPAPESHVHGCCHHHVSETNGYRQLLVHPLVHTAKIFVFIFAVTLGLNGLIAWVGEENLGSLMLRKSLFQPFLTALVGLIPNCAASVTIAGLFLKGGLSFGSTIAGLSCSGGLGLLVLLRENRPMKDTLRMIVLLVLISTAAGLAIQMLFE